MCSYAYQALPHHAVPACGTACRNAQGVDLKTIRLIRILVMVGVCSGMCSHAYCITMPIRHGRGWRACVHVLACMTLRHCGKM